MSQFDNANMYQATFEATFMKKLSNTEAELRKSIAYKKDCISDVWKYIAKCMYLTALLIDKTWKLIF